MPPLGASIRALGGSAGHDGGSIRVPLEAALAWCHRWPVGHLRVDPGSCPPRIEADLGTAHSTV